MRKACLVVFGGWALLALVAATATAPAVPSLGRVRFKGRAVPAFYVRYRDSKLWIASSFDALATVKPLRLVRTRVWYDDHDHYYLRDREYAEVKLAGPMGRFSEVRMRPVVSVMLDEPDEPDPPEGANVDPELRFLYRDTSGAVWDYRTMSMGRLTPTDVPRNAELLELTVPDPRQLRLALHATAAGASIGLSVEATLGQELLHHLQRNGRAYPVRATITNARGKVVHSVARDIWGLRDRGATEAHYARVPKGTYTITATIGRTPFSAPVAVSEKVVVK